MIASAALTVQWRRAPFAANLRFTDFGYSVTFADLLKDCWKYAAPEGCRMKKFSLGVVAGFLACWGVGFAAPNFDHNGVFWNQLNGSAKAGYVSGYDDAMQV